MLDASLEDFDALRRSVGQGWGLPVASYSDLDWLARERAAILDRSWYYIGMAQSIPNPGDVLLGKVAGIPVVITRDGQGELHALVNVCRHRGHPVCQQAGNRRGLSCPYHGWTYGLDGQLRGAPGSEHEDDFDKAAFGLERLKLDTIGPIIMVSPDPGAKPLRDHFPDLEKVLNLRAFNLDPQAYALHRRYECTVKANWKIWYDNTLECFHCPHVHGSSFNDAYAVDQADYECLIKDRVVSYYFPPKPARDANRLQVTWNKHMHLFPGFFITQQDDIMLVHQMQVIDTDTTHVYWDILAQEGADPDRVEAWSKIWDDTLTEDKAAVEAVHNNISPRTFSANRYMHGREPVPGHINSWVLDALGAAERPS